VYKCTCISLSWSTQPRIASPHTQVRRVWVGPLCLGQAAVHAGDCDSEALPQGSQDSLHSECHTNSLHQLFIVNTNAEPLLACVDNAWTLWN
jgi:hypothetical protein